MSGQTPFAESRAPAADNSIGLLRIVLAGAVLWGHSWYLAGRAGDEPFALWLFNGNEAIAAVGVKGFFVLSGYLVMRSENRLGSTRRFLWHRLLRVYPGLWACLLITGVAFPAIATVVGIGPANWPNAFAYVSNNLVLMRRQLAIDGLFANVPMPGDLNGSLWTLPYELGCYTGLAVLGWLGLTRAGSRVPVCIGAALLLLYAHDVLRPETAWIFKTHGRQLAAYFIVGALAACGSETLLRRALNIPVILAGVIAYALACRFDAGVLVGPFALSASALGLAWTLPARGFERRAGGDYSYGVYIYAYPVQQALAAAGVLSLGIAAYIGSVAVITFVLAYASWHLVEKRALAWKALGASSHAALRHPAHA